MEGARQRIARLARSFDEQDAGLQTTDPLAFEGYAEQRARARAESGLPEACVWGWADIGGLPCALVVFDFAFLGGSMGVVVGEKVARAFEGAAERRLPVVTVCSSGGARMQEGMVALVQMAKTAAARARHARAGLGHVSLLTSPTTGGVYASFASLADVIFSEPGATIGFAGPRVVTELTGNEPPPEMHTAEWAVVHGLVDALVPGDAQPEALGRALRNLTGAPPPEARPPADGPEVAHAPDPRTAWERLALARHPGRPKAPMILDALLDDSLELRGDRRGSDDPSVVSRLGALRGTGRRVLAIGLDPSVGAGTVSAGGFHEAIRCLETASRLGLPVVTLVDTRGADPLEESSGVAAAIARTFTTLLEAPVPTLAVVTGEGGSGGALALAAADRVLCWENAVFSVIAPEGAASILYRDRSRAAELAERLRITPSDLVELGVADAVVSEPAEGAHSRPEEATEALVGAVVAEVERLAAEDREAREAARGARWRRAGNRHLEPQPDLRG